MTCDDHDLVMSSTTAKTSASDDKVDVSFATDDEDETSSTSSSEGKETSSSSSESDAENGQKSDGDGDADDESEMPTFTLSLQPSTTALDDDDDALPDLSLSATSGSSVTQQETAAVSTVVTKISSSSLSERTGASTETTTMTDVATTQSTSSGAKIVAAETPVEVTISVKNEVKEESLAESDESEESEEETEDQEEEEEEKEQIEEEQNLPSSSTATSSSAPVSTTLDIKEDLKVTSSKLAKAGPEVNVQEEVEEHIAIAVVETKKTIHNAEESVSKSSVTKIEDEHSSVTKQQKNAAIEATAVAMQAADAKIDAYKKETNLSMKTAADEVTKLDVTNDTEVASILSVSSSDTQLSKKHKDPANKKAASEKTKADMVDTSSPKSPSADIEKTDDVKHKDNVRKTSDKTTKLSAVQATVAKLPKTSESDETNKLKTTKQSETVDNTKSSKSNKTEVKGKEVKRSVAKTVDEKQAAPVTVAAEQSTAKSESEKIKTSKTIVSDADQKAEVNQEKTTEVQKHKMSDSASESATVVEKTAKLKSKELIEDAANSISETTEANAGEVSGSTDNASAKQTGTEMSEGKVTSKKKSKHSPADGKESEVKNLSAESQALGSNLEPVDIKSENILKTKVGVKSKKELSSITVTNSEKEKDRTEAQPNKKESLPEATFSDEAKIKDSKLNGVEDKGKLTLAAADEAEFRPRRNSIDEFIKRILAEAREEQKKILDSCAVSASSETTTTETSALSSSRAADGLPSSKDTESELPQPVENGLDVGSTTKTTRRIREDFDIDDELADISRYFAKRTLIDHASTTDDEPPAQTGSAISTDDSKMIANGDEKLAARTVDEEPLHFVPHRRESTAAVVRESSRPVRVLVDQQTSVIRQLNEASRAVDELDNEIRQLRQSVGGREALYASIGAAIRDELRIYELELNASAERLNQQRLPGGGRFIREQFVAQCASELLQRSAVNGPRLDHRAASVDDWSRVGRRRSGSFSVDDDVAASTRNATRQWTIQTSFDRDPTADLLIQLRHSRSASVVSDRGYSSNDNTADESSRATTTSSLLSRLTPYNGGSSTAATELDLSRFARASSEARSTYSRSQSISDDWLSTPGGSHYTVTRQYVGYVRDTANDTDSELRDIGYHHRVSAARPPTQPSYFRRYQAPSFDAAAAPPYSRLYVRRGSLQSYGSYDSGGSTGDDAAGRSFNSRFLLRVREKKALGETTTSTSRQTSSDRPFRSRFLKSSSVTGSSASSTTSRSAAQYETEDD